MCWIKRNVKKNSLLHSNTFFSSCDLSLIIIYASCSKRIDYLFLLNLGIEFLWLAHGFGVIHGITGLRRETTSNRLFCLIITSIAVYCIQFSCQNSCFKFHSKQRLLIFLIIFEKKNIFFKLRLWNHIHSKLIAKKKNWKRQIFFILNIYTYVCILWKVIFASYWLIFLCVMCTKHTQPSQYLNIIFRYWIF